MNGREQTQQGVLRHEMEKLAEASAEEFVALRAKLDLARAETKGVHRLLLNTETRLRAALTEEIERERAAREAFTAKPLLDRLRWLIFGR